LHSNASYKVTRERTNGGGTEQDTVSSRFCLRILMKDRASKEKVGSGG